MQCNYVREMILTDYTDNELTAEKAKEISNHIANCNTCFDFYKQVQQKTIVPIRFLETKKVPSHVWEKIYIETQKISKKQIKVSFPKIFLECACVSAVIVSVFSFVSILTAPVYTYQETATCSEYLTNKTVNTEELLYLYQ